MKPVSTKSPTSSKSKFTEIGQYRTDSWYQYFINDGAHFLVLFALVGLAVSFALTKIASRVRLTFIGQAERRALTA